MIYLIKKNKVNILTTEIFLFNERTIQMVLNKEFDRNKIQIFNRFLFSWINKFNNNFDKVYRF